VFIILELVLRVLAALPCCKCLTARSGQLRDAIYWNPIIRLILESYLEFSIAAQMNLISIDEVKKGGHNLVNNMFLVLYLSIIVLMPILSLFLLIRYRVAIQKEKNFELQRYKRVHYKGQLDTTKQLMPLHEKWGSLFEGLKTDRPSGLLFNIFFLMRRLIFSLILVWCAALPWF
jgi:hypothetical protein